jgi:hypothetical protein
VYQNYIANRVAHSTLEGKTPFEYWYGVQPDLGVLRIFGCRAMVKENSPVKKLDIKAIEMIFLGMSEIQKGYLLLNHQTGKIIVNRNVSFNENAFGIPVNSMEEDLVSSGSETDEVNVEAPRGPAMAPTGLSVPFSEITESRGTHETEEDIMQESSGYQTADDSENYLEEDNGEMNFINQSEQVSEEIQDRNEGFVQEIVPERYNLRSKARAYYSDVVEPQSINEALKSPEKDEWKIAMNREYDSLMLNETWDIVSLPPGRKAIGCKWVFKLKRDSSGEIVLFKARLVAKGYHQKYGIDYEETFAPVMHFTSLRILLTIAATKDYEIEHIDVKTAFLNGVLGEEVYMIQPPYYEMKGKENHVCHLKKTIYGLKQSPFEWNREITNFLNVIDLKQLTSEASIFKDRKTEAMLGLYVDDQQLIGLNGTRKDDIKKLLFGKYRMEDLGPLSQYLGITFTRNRNQKTIFLSQENYIKEILDEFEMTDAKVATTPIEPGHQMLEESDGKINVTFPYRQLVGKLIYLSSATRPDIAYTVGVLSRVLDRPQEVHINGAKRLLRYLKYTMGYGLLLGKLNDRGNVFKLKGYSDSSYNDDQVGKATSGNLSYLGDSCISWKSKKQSVVTTSTQEAEYIALCHETQDLISLKMILEELGVPQEEMIIYEDNKATIALSEAPRRTKRSSHINVKYHYTRQMVQCKEVRLVYCETQNMVADILTKGLHKNQFEKFREALGVVCVTSINKPSGRSVKINDGLLSDN